MTRTKGGFITKKHHKKIIKFTSGFYNSQSRLFKTANQEYMRSLRYSYIDRKNKKNDMRKLWIKQINITAKLRETTYSTVINKLKKNKIILNKKILSKLCLNDEKTIEKILMNKEQNKTNKK